MIEEQTWAGHTMRKIDNPEIVKINVDPEPRGEKKPKPSPEQSDIQ